MKTQSPSLAACVVVGVSCLAWVGGLTSALVYFLELSTSTGWLIASLLGFSSTVAITMIIYEMRHAVELPDGFDDAEFDKLLPVSHWGPSMGVTAVPKHAVPAFRVPGDIC